MNRHPKVTAGGSDLHPAASRISAAKAPLAPHPFRFISRTTHTDRVQKGVRAYLTKQKVTLRRTVAKDTTAVVWSLRRHMLRQLSTGYQPNNTAKHTEARSRENGTTQKTKIKSRKRRNKNGSFSVDKPAFQLLRKPVWLCGLAGGLSSSIDMSAAVYGQKRREPHVAALSLSSGDHNRMKRAILPH